MSLDADVLQLDQPLLDGSSLPPSVHGDLLAPGHADPAAAPGLEPPLRPEPPPRLSRPHAPEAETSRRERAPPHLLVRAAGAPRAAGPGPRRSGGGDRDRRRGRDRRPRRVALGARRARRRGAAGRGAGGDVRPGRRPHGGGVAAADARVRVAAARASAVRLRAQRRPGPACAAPGRGAARTLPDPGGATAAARRPARGGRLSRAPAGDPVRALRPAADLRARLPRRRVLAARPGRPGASPGPLGPRAVRGRRHARSGACSGSSAPRRPRATSSCAGCTPSATRRSRCAARR